MDTSTLTFPDDITLPNTVPQTSLLSHEAPKPIAAEWLTRLMSISPLTSSHLNPPESPQSTMAHSYVYQNQDQYPVPQQPPQPGSGSGTGRHGGDPGLSTLLLIFIPIMVVILTVLLGLVFFLVAVLFMRRRKGIK
jgi:hypothetical protein